MRLIYTLLFLLSVLTLSAQDTLTIRGTVRDARTRAGLPHVTVSSPGLTASVQTGDQGEFSIRVSHPKALLKFQVKGYFSQEQYLNGRTSPEVYLMPVAALRYNETTTDRVTIHRKDLNMSYSSPGEAIVGQIPGVQALQSSGMPGEGTFLQYRGLRSFAGNNAPLIVVDGMPYLPDMSESPVISGYSPDMFRPLNLKEIESITFAKGHDVARFGSLASNGVIFIQTEKATDMETKVEIQTVNGISWMNKRMPLLDSKEFKNYIGDVGATALTDANQLIEFFPFLKDDPSYHYNYIYDNHTDWQEEVFSPAFSTENILKIKGGDAVANYALSIGYLQNNGVVDNTSMSKYYTRLNANMTVTPRLKMFASAGFTYNDNKLMEQGLVVESNPMLASLLRAPLLSIREKNSKGTFLPKYEGIRQFGISNPSAILADVDATSKAYNILVNAGLDYSVTPHLTFSTLVGIYYNYNSDNLFIPGKDYTAIAPLAGGMGENLVRAGIGESFNTYFNVSGRYQKTFGQVHGVEAQVGFQLMSTSQEFDKGQGLNTKSDFFRTLGDVDANYGRSISGWQNNWNWMNFYFDLAYNYGGLLTGGVTATVDGSSSVGEENDFFRVYPGTYLSYNLKSHPFLQQVNSVDRLSLRAEYSMTANSRYSSLLGKYFYRNKRYRTLSGSVRDGIPNSQLHPEENTLVNLSLDLGMFGNRLILHGEIYEEQTRDMIFDRQAASLFGFGTIWDNAGKIRTRGAEVSLQATLVRNSNLEWVIGGNVATYRSKLMCLGNEEQRVREFRDGSALISKTGEAPYQFYGYQAEKVISDEAEAARYNVTSFNGKRFNAGDMLFSDGDNDHRISTSDRVALGRPTPDFYGGFYTMLRYRMLTLSADFSYSYGNDVYNGVRRLTESPQDFGNKSRAVLNRWNSEGQQTDMPKADYGDPMGNNRFSSRWIEDGSFLKLKNVTLAWDLPENLWFFQNVQVWVSGENLCTFSKYLGYDPEFAASYDPAQAGFDLGKIPAARSVKLGIKVNF